VPSTKHSPASRWLGYLNSTFAHFQHIPSVRQLQCNARILHDHQNSNLALKIIISLQNATAFSAATYPLFHDLSINVFDKPLITDKGSGV